MTTASSRTPLPVTALALFTVAALSACGGGGDSGGQPATPPRVASIAVTPDAVTLDALEATAQLQATARDAGGNSMNAVFNWTSADTTVASVTSSGLVTAQGNGMTTVTVASGSVTQAVSVSVQQRLARLALSPDAVLLEALGANSQLEVTPQDANGHRMSADVRWTSSDPSIVTVDGDGLVTAKGHGTATVTATSGTYSATVTVNVSLYPAIILIPSSSVLDALGATVQLNAQVLDANGEEVSEAVHWDSADPLIATVDARGRVTARGNGVADITARVDSRSASATVTVRQRVSSWSIEPWSNNQNPLTFESLGETVQFSVDARDANGHSVADASISAQSRHEDVVVIDRNLLATAVGNGTAAISFDVNDSGTGFSVRVRQVPVSLRIEPSTRTFREVGETHPFTPHVTDANGYALSDDLFIWQVLDRRIATVDGSGVVTIRGVGETDVTLSAGERSVSATVIGELQATCDSGTAQPVIVGVQPQPLVEGASVRIQGTGFCGQAAGNLVTVDRTVAQVTEASATELSITVPQFHCLPPRDVAVAVAVGANRASRSVALSPDESVVSVAVGHQQILGAGQEKCLQFSAAADSEAYLIGVQSTRVPADRSPRNALTPLRLVASTSALQPRSALALERRRQVWSTTPGTASAGSSEPIVSHWMTPESEPAAHEITSQTAAIIEGADLDTLPEVGDRVTLPYCSDELFVHTIGTRALWLVNYNLREFVDQYPGRIAELADTFDTAIYPVIADYFGVPDLGNVERVLVVICHESLAGAFASGNSIRTDIFVSAATMAHEFTHTVQWDHQTDFRFSDWFAEGQASLGQEVFGFAVTNRHPAQNYGRDVAYTTDYPNPGAWQETFERLSGYLSGAYEARPHECGWISMGRELQCGASLEYGVGWSFLRWLTDQYARQYPGGDSQFHREMLRSERDQLGAIERLLDSPIETLLAQWAAAMYVDDRVPGAHPTLQFTSWNFRDVYRDDPDRLIPQEISFDDVETTARLRDGSTWYLRVSGDGRPAVAIGVESPDNNELPDEIQLWVVRLE